MPHLKLTTDDANWLQAMHVIARPFTHGARAIESSNRPRRIPRAIAFDVLASILRERDAAEQRATKWRSSFYLLLSITVVAAGLAIACVAWAVNG